jgi:hypothetical protein
MMIPFDFIEEKRPEESDRSPDPAHGFATRQDALPVLCAKKLLK